MTYYADNLKKSIITTGKRITQMAQELAEKANAAYRDDIIRMAKEAGWENASRMGWHDGFWQRLERFAALVAVAEREALKEERRRDMAEICSLRESEESLREEVERLRDELRQSSIDHTRAEVERLREALVRFGRHQKECDAYRGCVCGLDAALRDETAIWSARHDPRE